MKKPISLAFVLLVIALLGSSTHASGILYTPGVIVGTSATYHYADNSSTSWFVINVTGITTPNVTYSRAVYNNNGVLQTNHSFVHDIMTVPTTLAFFFIGANLGSGSQVVPGMAYYAINGTKTVHYAGKSWTANWMNTTVSGVIIDAVWDKPTGILLYQWRNDTLNVWTNITMVPDSSLPKTTSTTGIPDVVGVVCAASGIAVMAIVVKRKVSISNAV